LSQKNSNSELFKLPPKIQLC